MGTHACPYQAGSQEAADWIVGWNERAGEDKGDQQPAETFEDRTEHMSPEAFRVATGADSI